jgi:chemotaxis protein MotB
VLAQGAQPIIIVKKKNKGHAGHHGGAWKVAFADFVTAMMALFIVLWLLSSSEQVKKAVGGYFSDPTGHGKDVGNGLRGSGSETLSIHKDDMDKLKDKLEQAIKSAPALQKIKEHVVLTVTAEGLRVDMIEGEKSTFFESGSSMPTDFGKDLLRTLGQEIGKLPNRLTMEGHTDSRPYVGQAGYTNWELSADRANASRRWMQENGLRADQVTQVRGYADQSLRDPAHPNDATNRRVSLIIQYQAPEPPAAKPTAAPGQKPGTAPPSAPAAAPAGQKAGTAAPAVAPAAKPSPMPVPPVKGK